MNLPNSLTLTRIFLVPLLVVVLLTKFEGRLILGVTKEIVGAAIFGLASLTDWLDGYLARRRKEVTTLGQVIAWTLTVNGSGTLNATFSANRLPYIKGLTQ